MIVAEKKNAAEGSMAGKTATKSTTKGGSAAAGTSVAKPASARATSAKAATKPAAKAPAKPAAKPATKAPAKTTATKSAAKSGTPPASAAPKAPAKSVAAPAVPVAAAGKPGNGGIYDQATAEAERIGTPERKAGAGYVLHEYPSYQAYVDVQTAGNKAKLRRQYVKRSHVDRLAAWLRDRGHPVSAGICHGTRAGREQKWFRRGLKCIGIFGTEISDTAAEFPFTVQWDFHDVNPDWVGKHDFVYSNSWDHAFDPRRAFTAWLGQLRKGGLLLIDYTAGQAPAAANALDPFGIEIAPLQEMLAEVGRAAGAEPAGVLDFTDNPEYRARVVVMRKL